MPVYNDEQRYGRDIQADEDVANKKPEVKEDDVTKLW